MVAIFHRAYLVFSPPLWVNRYGINVQNSGSKKAQGTTQRLRPSGWAGFASGKPFGGPVLKHTNSGALFASSLLKSFQTPVSPITNNTASRC